MDEQTKKKWALALGILAVAVVLVAGIFRTVGCEKGEAITDQVGNAIEDVKDAVPGLGDGGEGGAVSAGGTGGIAD